MPPWVVIALLFSLLVAVGYQILAARSIARVPLYWFTIFVPFVLAAAASNAVDLHSPQLGELQVIPILLAVGVGVAVLRTARV